MTLMLDGGKPKGRLLSYDLRARAMPSVRYNPRPVRRLFRILLNGLTACR